MLIDGLYRRLDVAERLALGSAITSPFLERHSRWIFDWFSGVVGKKVEKNVIHRKNLIQI